MEQIKTDIQKIFDFCETQRNMLDKSANQVKDFNMQVMLTSQATAFFNVQQFIVQNFKQDIMVKTNE